MSNDRNGAARTAYQVVTEHHTETRLNIFGGSCRIVLGHGASDDHNPLELVRDEMTRLEAKFATHVPGSVIERLNRAAGTGDYTPLDAESRSLFSYVTVLWEKSNHLYDPSTAVLLSGCNQLPVSWETTDQLNAQLQLVGWSRLELSRQGARLTRHGMHIDLDNCIRPYAIDSVRKLLLKQGVATALIEMDQDTASIGKQPDGANWLVGVRHPRGPRTAIARLKLNDRAFALRGNFEHRLNIAGENFGRALSPVDGQPVPGLLSVAVIAENCLTACSAASIARLKTEQAGLRWLARLGLPWLAVDRSLNCHGPLAPA